MIALMSLIALLLLSAAAEAADVVLSTTVGAHFLSIEQARDELSKRDSFITALSPFDRAARLKKAKPVDQKEFIDFVAAQALDWTASERQNVTAAFEQIRDRIAPYTKHLPFRIALIKTTGLEEGNAAYCRGYAIILPVGKLQASSDQLRKLLSHELFHILSRKNGQLRNRLYGLIGFKPCAPVRLPEPYFSRKLTNPDAPWIQHYIQVAYRGSSVKAMPVLFSKQADFDPNLGNDFFAYLTFKLMVIEQRGDEWRVALLNNEPQLLDVRELDNFFEQIGRNTNYILHPEEILADNFQLLLEAKTDVPNPELIEKLAAELLSAPGTK